MPNNPNVNEQNENRNELNQNNVENEALDNEEVHREEGRQENPELEEKDENIIDQVQPQDQQHDQQDQQQGDGNGNNEGEVEKEEVIKDNPPPVENIPGDLPKPEEKKEEPKKEEKKEEPKKEEKKDPPPQEVQEEKQVETFGIEQLLSDPKLKGRLVTPLDNRGHMGNVFYDKPSSRNKKDGEKKDEISAADLTRMAKEGKLFLRTEGSKNCRPINFVGGKDNPNAFTLGDERIAKKGGPYDPVLGALLRLTDRYFQFFFGRTWFQNLADKYRSFLQMKDTRKAEEKAFDKADLEAYRKRIREKEKRELADKHVEKQAKKEKKAADKLKKKEAKAEEKKKLKEQKAADKAKKKAEKEQKKQEEREKRAKKIEEDYKKKMQQDRERLEEQRVENIREDQAQRGIHDINDPRNKDNGMIEMTEMTEMKDMGAEANPVEREVQIKNEDQIAPQKKEKENGIQQPMEKARENARAIREREKINSLNNDGWKARMDDALYKPAGIAEKKQGLVEKMQSLGGDPQRNAVLGMMAGCFGRKAEGEDAQQQRNMQNDLLSGKALGEQHKEQLEMGNEAINNALEAYNNNDRKPLTDLVHDAMVNLAKSASDATQLGEKHALIGKNLEQLNAFAKERGLDVKFTPIESNIVYGASEMGKIAAKGINAEATLSGMEKLDMTNPHTRDLVGDYLSMKGVDYQLSLENPTKLSGVNIVQYTMGDTKGLGMAERKAVVEKNLDTMVNSPKKENDLLAAVKGENDLRANTFGLSAEKLCTAEALGVNKNGPAKARNLEFERELVKKNPNQELGMGGRG